MLKLCFPDGNEYELKEIPTSQFQVTKEKSYPNFRFYKTENVHFPNVATYTYEAVKFSGKYYAFELLNKEQI